MVVKEGNENIENWEEEGDMLSSDFKRRWSCGEGVWAN